MEKMKKIALVMALMMAFATLTACSGAPSLEGTWKVTNITGEGLDLGLDGLDAEQMFSSGLIEMTFTFSDGTVTMRVSAFGESADESGTYTVNGDKVTIAGSGEMTYKIDGSKLTLTMDEGSIILERQK